MSAAASASGYLKPPRLAFSSILTQFYPPRPAFTEKDIPDLSGKVSRSLSSFLSQTICVHRLTLLAGATGLRSDRL